MKLFNSIKFRIVSVYIYHIITIILAYFMMPQYPDSLFGFSFILGILFLIYWIILSIKTYTNLALYGHFLIGTIIELALHLLHIIPEDSGFFSGLGQFLYICYIIIFLVLLGIIQSAIWFIIKIKNKKG